jgi:hypothetical protein
MVVQQLELVFNDTPSQHNQDLTNFLKRNLEKIIKRGQIKFKYKIAKTRDLRALQERGIKRLPALIPQKGRSIVGVPNIVEFLRETVKKNKTEAAPKSEEEVLNDYMQKAMMDGVTRDADGKMKVANEKEDMDTGDQLRRDMERAMQERESSGLHNPKHATRDPPQKPSWSVQMDDDMADTRSPADKYSRRDNIGGDPGDPTTAMRNISTGNEDDGLMAAFLEKIGGDDF